AEAPAPAARAVAAAPVAPPVAAAAAVVAAAAVPLPAPKPDLPAAPAAVVVADANVPLPLAHPAREPAPGMATAGPAILAATVPSPPARPAGAGLQVAAAMPAAGLPALITTGGALAASAPTVDVERGTLSYASAGSFAAPRTQPGQAPVAPALPAGSALAHAPAAAHAARPAAAHGPARPATAEAQAEIRRLFSSPTVAQDTTLRTPELRRFAAFVAAPRQVVDGGFGRDASGGLDTARFTGAAVVAVPVVTLASATPLPPRRYWTASN
ncbi:hypothetical protein KHC27_21190, partial [Ancylobacter lacus]|nr:hypothetical protein [Ancylobacter lacus]